MNNQIKYPEKELLETYQFLSKGPRPDKFSNKLKDLDEKEKLLIAREMYDLNMQSLQDLKKYIS